MTKEEKLMFSIILLNHNNVHYTVDCIESIKKSSYPSYEIIVVDNASEKDEAEILRKKFPDVKIIASKINHWFAEGNNVGVRSAKGKYIVILNNDTIVDQDWLQKVANVFNDPSVAIVQCRTYAKFSKEKYFYDNNNMQSLVGTPLLNKNNYDKNGLKDSFLAVGCALIYPYELFKEPFDKDYLINAEDTALAFQARIMGYKVKEIKDSVIYHLGNVTMKKKNTKGFWLKERNYLMNLLIYYQPKTLFKLSPLIISSILLRNLYHPTMIHVRFSSYFWLLKNFFNILKKRKKMQSLRKVDDSELFKAMSYKFIDTDNLSKFTKKIVQTVNGLSYLYCKLFRIKTSEFYKKL